MPWRVHARAPIGLPATRRNDGHVSLDALADAPDLSTQWPGFLTGFEGDAQVVMTVDGGGHAVRHWGLDCLPATGSMRRPWLRAG